MSRDDRTAALLAALDDFNAAWATRNLEGLMAQFAPDSDVLLLGSEQGETARGPAELRRLLAFFFEEPVTYRWDWHRRDVFGSGDLAWVVAEGPIVEAGPEGETQIEYRISGVLERRDGRWLWRLFHGSAPDPPHADWGRIVPEG
ncbi:MAG: SgcJ/EcaC family oxidoreductase [Gaiellaceae bacterium]